MPMMPGPQQSAPAPAPQEPIQSAGEQLITQLFQMAASNPQMLMGLALAGSAREISQITGLSRRRGGATPTAATMLSGNRGEIDRILALQQLMQGAPGAGGAGMAGPGPMAMGAPSSSPVGPMAGGPAPSIPIPGPGAGPMGPMGPMAAMMPPGAMPGGGMPLGIAPGGPANPLLNLLRLRGGLV